MKTNSVFNEINILSAFIFQVAVLGEKFFIRNKRELSDHGLSPIQRSSQHSVLSKGNEITGKLYSKNTHGAYPFGNHNYYPLDKISSIWDVIILKFSCYL